jgi:hypothetical protein
VINVPIMGIGRLSALRIDWPIRAQEFEGAQFQNFSFGIASDGS